ncbi:hypothetical protein [Hyphomicrobium sp. NDB2Meth4]|uniref:hypothetical protein n=1 Tax=Hyphomicrobium sp. NDB2Meth4 TaxID=1892846 RepID=UPI0009310538|nr:hypothetical protein [Hyphomicrobium sp. NDB2Meth4]
MPRDEVRRAMKVGNLSPEAKEAAHKHGLADNRDALLEAAKAKTPEAQAEVIRQRAAQAKPRTPSAPPGDKPVSAKRMSSKRKCSENNCVAGLAQEPVLHLFEGDRLAARIISARNGVQLFVARPEGLRMVGRYPNRRRAIAALAGVLP